MLCLLLCVLLRRWCHLHRGPWLRCILPPPCVAATMLLLPMLLLLPMQPVCGLPTKVL